MKTELLNKAIALGLTTQEELKAFERGYNQGQKDTYDEVMEDMKEFVEPLEKHSFKDEVDTRELNSYMNLD